MVTGNYIYKIHDKKGQRKDSFTADTRICGTDSKGRSIGYAHEATCDYPGCDKKIDRGLAYTCGGMHGEFDIYCESYFCENHLTTITYLGETNGICLNCWKESGEHDEDSPAEKEE